jgi:hypothetical protein
VRRSLALKDCEPGSRGTSAVGSNVTENTGLCAIVICEV